MAAFFRGRGRYVLYGALLLSLTALLALTVWQGVTTGAFLTDEADWQDLAGTYRIGVIDYTVDVNGQTLIDQQGSAGGSAYKMAVPLTGAVRIFDSTLTDSALRGREFGEGATLARVRVINRSDSLVEVSAVLTLTGGDGTIRVLPLPEDMTETEALRLDRRQYVLSTLGYPEAAGQTYDAAGETAALMALEASYKTYFHGTDPEMDFYLGILPGAKQDGAAREGVIVENGRAYSYKDIFLLLWSDYGEGEYNLEHTEEPARWGQVKATFTVGQLD